MEDKLPKRLSEIPKKEVFPAPKDYFDSLQGRIDARIQKPKGKLVDMTPRLWVYGSLAAAMITLAILFGPSLFSSSNNTLSAEQLLASIPEQDLLAYMKYTELEVEDLLELPEPELWNAAIEDSLANPSLDNEDLDMLYEQYGVSSDEALQIL